MPTDNTSIKSSSTRVAQDQRPQTAGSGRVSNEPSLERDRQHTYRSEGKSLQGDKLSDERGAEGIFKQKINGNYSLPSSPLGSNFSHGAYKTDAGATGYQEQSINYKAITPMQAYPVVQLRQQDSQHIASKPAMAGSQKPRDSFPSQENGYDIRSSSNSTNKTQGHNHIQGQGLYGLPFHSHQDSYSDAIPSSYEYEPVMRQVFDGHGLGWRSSSEEDMPDFSVLSLSDTNGAKRPSEDLHLQPPLNTLIEPPVMASLQVERGRGVAQKPDEELAALAQRSRSQPNYRNLSQPVIRQVEGFDFGSNRNPHIHHYLLAQTNHLPCDRPCYSQREPSAETSYSVRSTPSITSSHLKSTQPTRFDRHSDGMGKSSPVIGHSMRSNRSFPFRTDSQRPQDQTIPSTSEGARVGLVAESPDKILLPSSHNSEVPTSHPAPVRPGLFDQALKPPPIRRYDNRVSPLSQAISSSSLSSITPQHERASPKSLAQVDINQLRRVVHINSNDMKAQLALARKMVEMSSALADQDSQADPKQRAKNREKLIFDAHKMVKKLVNSGYVEAMFYLADCNGRGLLGLENDPKEAFNLYLSAAKLGHAASAYRVAVCCEMGQDEGGGTRRDPLKAVQWYKRAATLGDTPAMYKIGMIQLKGLLGQPRNPREAIVWLKRAAERADEDNPHALHELVRSFVVYRLWLLVFCNLLMNGLANRGCYSNLLARTITSSAMKVIRSNSSPKPPRLATNSHSIGLAPLTSMARLVASLTLGRVLHGIVKPRSKKNTRANWL